MNIDTPYRIMIDLIQGILCESNGHAGGATKIYNEIVKPLQEAAKAAALLRQQDHGVVPGNAAEAFRELRELTSGYWDKFNTNEEINNELRGHQEERPVIDWENIEKEYKSFCTYKNITNRDIFRWLKNRIQKENK
jgi:hypothetical protein